jgi:hypothetical protein
MNEGAITGSRWTDVSGKYTDAIFMGGSELS